MEKEILMYDISVCLAAIRKDNWVRLYNSIKESVEDYTFELIFCGPHAELPVELQELDNFYAKRKGKIYHLDRR